MAVVYLSMGSNAGQRRSNCRFGLSRLFDFGKSSLLARSGIYETEPVGYKEQGWFLNLAVKIETLVDPFELLKELKMIEAESGRDFNQIRFGPRTLDIDILLYEDFIIDSKELVVPHPRMHERRFVLKPLCDIDPDLVHPVLKKKVSRLLEELAEDDQKVTLSQCDL